MKRYTPAILLAFILSASLVVAQQLPRGRLDQDTSPVISLVPAIRANAPDTGAWVDTRDYHEWPIHPRRSPTIGGQCGLQSFERRRDPRRVPRQALLG